jgi:hypothetical protein
LKNSRNATKGRRCIDSIESSSGTLNNMGMPM